ncbi:hypothetical protein [Cytophaga aurantiaca]|uniref:hypothetical protein n=1 Tax=Cytophaga aurantiaca TaxID=29530 RepID=UPI00036955BB|nr:hypothetical protein [Cytophaga aurantiaca]
MKKIGSIVVFICSIVSVYAQVDFDRPEAFLFERKNRLLKEVDSTDSDQETVSTKNKTFSLEKEKEYKAYFSAYGSGYINSNAITNSFIKAYLYTKSYIDSDLKQQQVDRLKKSNSIGVDLKAGIYGQHTFKKIRVEAGLNYRDFYSSQYSADAYKLAFYGNSMYAGQTASLDPMSMYNVNYQTIYLGVKKTVGKKQNIQLGARLGFVRGGRLQRIHSKNLSLYTANDGSYLTLNGKFDVAYTDDSTYSAVPSMNGAGLTSDYFFSIKGKQSELAIELLDVGFVRWNDVATYKGDGSYTYDGIAIDNIIGGNGIVLDPVNLATIFENMGIHKTVKDVTYMLPSTVHVSYYRHLSPKVTITGGVRQQFVHGYIPKIYGKLAYYLKKDFVLIPTLSYGGFGRADVELGIAKSFSEHLLVSANLMWFEYLVAPSKTSGQGMSVAFSYYF